MRSISLGSQLVDLPQSGVQIRDGGVHLADKALLLGTWSRFITRLNRVVYPAGGGQCTFHQLLDVVQVIVVGHAQRLENLHYLLGHTAGGAVGPQELLNSEIDVVTVSAFDSHRIDANLSMSHLGRAARGPRERPDA